MKKMDDMSREELIETEKKINGVWRQHEDAFAPDRVMDVKEIEYIKCPGPGCARYMLPAQLYCSDECYDAWIKEFEDNQNRKLLKKRLEEKCKTLNLLK